MKNSHKICSVIISNRNDLAMLNVTLRSALEELKPLGRDCGEVVICDNSDPHAAKHLETVVPGAYIRSGEVQLLKQDFPCLFTAREKAIRAAKGFYVICLDSHMLVGHNMILDLVNFMERNQDLPIGFAHAPICWSHQHERTARHDRDLSASELGPWGSAHDHEAKITWKGMPWICRRDWFLDQLGGYGALSENKMSWGGGDIHIGTKPWLLGYENWAVPTSPGIHIGPFPHLHSQLPRDLKPHNKYRVYTTSGRGPIALGYLVSCYVLGGEPMMHRNAEQIQNRFGRWVNVQRYWDKAKSFGQREKDWLDARKVITFEELLANPPWERSVNVSLENTVAVP